MYVLSLCMSFMSLLDVGLSVEAVDGAVNGCIVRSVSANEAVAKDGRLCVGDFVVAISDESLRRVTTAQAHAAILRQSAMLMSSITYVTPAQLVFRHCIIPDYQMQAFTFVKVKVKSTYLL